MADHSSKLVLGSEGGLEPVFAERDRFHTERIISLKAIVDERDRLYEAKFQALESKLEAALEAIEKSNVAQLKASEKAIDKSEQAQKEYNARSNEFRGQLDDQAKTLMARTETLSMFKATDDKLASFQDSIEHKVAAVEQVHRHDIATLRDSINKLIDSLQAQIVALRESRSAGSGKEEAQREATVQKNWSVGILMGVVFGILGFIGSVFGVMIHFLKT